ncbi:hypothetical protein D3C75_1113680 [compost metagenome]
MQAGTGGVQGQGGDVVKQGNLRHKSAPILREPFPVVAFLHFLHHRFFDNALAGRHTGQLGFMGAALGGELPVLGNPLVPRQRLGALKQLVKGSCLKFTHLNQHPVGGAQP